MGNDDITPLAPRGSRPRVNDTVYHLLAGAHYNGFAHGVKIWSVSCERINLYKIRCRRITLRSLCPVASYLTVLRAGSLDVKFETEFVVSRQQPTTLWNLAQTFPFGSSGITRHLGQTSETRKYDPQTSPAKFCIPPFSPARIDATLVSRLPAQS